MKGKQKNCLTASIKFVMVSVIVLVLLTLLPFGNWGVKGGDVWAGEKEDLQKDLLIINLTVEKNLYQNEYLKSQGQQIQLKLQAIERAEKAKDANPDPK